MCWKPKEYFRECVHVVNSPKDHSKEMTMWQVVPKWHRQYLFRLWAAKMVIPESKGGVTDH